MAKSSSLSDVGCGSTSASVTSISMGGGADDRVGSSSTSPCVASSMGAAAGTIMTLVVVGDNSEISATSLGGVMRAAAADGVSVEECGGLIIVDGAAVVASLWSGVVCETVCDENASGTGVVAIVDGTSSTGAAVGYGVAGGGGTNSRKGMSSGQSSNSLGGNHCETKFCLV